MKHSSSYVHVSLLDWPCLRKPAQHTCFIERGLLDGNSFTVQLLYCSYDKVTAGGYGSNLLSEHTYYWFYVAVAFDSALEMRAVRQTAPFTWILSQSGLPVATSCLPRVFGAYQLLWQDSFACCVALRFFESLGKCLPGEFILAAKPDFNKFSLGLLHSGVVDEEKKEKKNPNQSPTEGAIRKHWSPTGILTATACWQRRCVELITWNYRCWRLLWKSWIHQLVTSLL